MKGALAMPKSMTGYGRAKSVFGPREITVEIKSVNHRFFEFSAKYPRQYSFIEDKLKTLFSKEINRGKVEAYISISVSDGSDIGVEVNGALAGSYISALKSANESLGLADDLTLSQLLRMPDVFTVTRQEIDESELWSEISQVAEAALQSFMQMRIAEGDRLKDDIMKKLDSIQELVLKIESRSPQVVEEYKDRLYSKLCELLESKNIEQSRILTEAAIFADKTAVDEETVRLKSHVESFRELLLIDEPVGKKLDFIVQEMNREVNTTGSKCSDIEITKIVLELKSIVEKIREQIQNIE